MHRLPVPCAKSPRSLIMMLAPGRRGIALIITLWVIIIMTIMAYSILHEANINVELTRQFRDRFLASVLARSGVGRAIVDLKNDLRLDMAAVGTNQAIDAKGDPWAREDDEYTDSNSDRRLLHGFYTVRVVDENRFLPVNTTNLVVYSMLLQVLGLDEKEAEKVAAAIVDYIDPDDRPSLLETEADTEDKAYANLIGSENRQIRVQDVSYRNKNDRINTLDELLQIYGVTPALYYGSAWTGEDDPRIRWRRPRYYQRINRPPDYRPGLRDVLSVYNDTGLNLNTVEPEVSHAVFAMATRSLSTGEDATNSLVRHRPEPRGSTRRPPRNTDALVSFAQLTGLGIDVSTAASARSVANLGGRAFAYRIRSTGTVRGVSYTIETIVDRDWDVITRDDSRGRNSRRGAVSRPRGREKQTHEAPAIRVIEWREF